MGFRAFAGAALALVLSLPGAAAQERITQDLTRTAPTEEAIVQALDPTTVPPPGSPAPPASDATIVQPAARAEASVIAPLQFALNSAEVTPQSYQFLFVMARALNTPMLRDVVVLVEGHTDITGPYAYNIALSQRRATAVRDALIQMGVDPRRLVSTGYGPDHLLPGLASNDPRNRRVELARIL